MPPIPIIFAIAFVLATITLRSKQVQPSPNPSKEDTAELIARALENYLQEKKPNT